MPWLDAIGRGPVHRRGCPAQAGEVLGQQHGQRLDIDRLVAGVVGRVSVLTQERSSLAFEQFLVEDLAGRRDGGAPGLLDRPAFFAELRPFICAATAGGGMTASLAEGCGSGSTPSLLWIRGRWLRSADPSSSRFPKPRMARPSGG